MLLKELPGVRLTNRPELVDAKKVLREIMDTVREAYMKAGMINGDLSEYNILTDGATVWLIDWPQWVGKDHPNAKELMRRDVGAVAKFFERSYGLSADIDALVAYVTGGPLPRSQNRMTRFSRMRLVMLRMSLSWSSSIPSTSALTPDILAPFSRTIAALAIWGWSMGLPILLSILT